MPPGFSFLDAMLVCIPIGFAAMGLIRGAAVEMSSSLGCLVGAAAAWGLGQTSFVEALGQELGLIVALVAGVVAWRLSRRLLPSWGVGEQWTSAWGRGLDWLAGLLLGGVRGLALVCAACLACAMLAVPLGLSAPVKSVVYPVFAGLALQTLRPVLASTLPAIVPTAEAASPVRPAALPAVPPMHDVVDVAPPASAWALEAAAAARALTARTSAAAMPPAAAQPDIPVRQLPVNLVETHHNLLHPQGSASRRHTR